MSYIKFEMHEEIVGVGLVCGHVALTGDNKLQDELWFDEYKDGTITEKNIDEIKDGISHMRDKLEQVKLGFYHIFGFEIYQRGE